MEGSDANIDTSQLLALQKFQLNFELALKDAAVIVQCILFAIQWMLFASSIIENVAGNTVLLVAVGHTFILSQHMNHCSTIGLFAQRVYCLLYPTKSATKFNYTVFTMLLFVFIGGSTGLTYARIRSVTVDGSPVPDGCYSFNCMSSSSASVRTLSNIFGIGLTAASMLLGSLMLCLLRKYKKRKSTALDRKNNSFALYVFYAQFVFETFPMLFDIGFSVTANINLGQYIGPFGLVGDAIDNAVQVFVYLFLIRSRKKSKMFTNSSYQFANIGQGNTVRTQNLCIGKLPFYDAKDTILELKELPAAGPGLQKTPSKLQFKFDVHRSILNGLARSESAPLPRMELQLRFFSAGNAAVEQFDSFPPNCSVHIDGKAVTLPNVIPTNIPKTEAKRPSLPVNVTSYVNLAFTQHSLTVEWSGDNRFWAVAIYHVQHVNSAFLFKRLADRRYMRPQSVTKKTIIQRLNGDDDDGISMDSMKVSLLCPLSRTRMIMPAKGANCSHLQCFDLNSYLMMNERRSTWKCPICDQTSTAYNLVRDQYFIDILHKTDSSTIEVELLRDGSWRVVEVRVETLSDEENCDVMTCKKMSFLSKPHNVPKALSSTTENAQFDVITLDSDDEYDDDEMIAPYGAQTHSNRTVYPTTSQNRDIPLICLDDSDDGHYQLSTSTSTNMASGMQGNFGGTPSWIPMNQKTGPAYPSMNSSFVDQNSSFYSAHPWGVEVNLHATATTAVHLRMSYDNNMDITSMETIEARQEPTFVRHNGSHRPL
ncbi:hypothetical protein QR680_009919 [Steinernema hermaphroditum]|uniref:SP-RING-type domain-containing protein n=1 Tax=Steinernema hermaphroditum TaxID=289476 RepID=A0AA39INC7_9BILA|nr:hypothetical protein QR680_009919 [Steinernema hermaphroditum]